MINQTKEMYEKCITPAQPIEAHTIPEIKHQAKIIKYLEGLGWNVTRVALAGKSGTSDLIACSLTGQYWAIEVKRTNGKPSVLQLSKLKALRRNKAICMIAYGFIDFKYKLKLISELV